MHTRARLMSAAFAAVACGTLIAAAPVPFLDGYTVVMRISTDQPNNTPHSGTFKFAGDKMRVEIELPQAAGSRGGAMMAGGYMLQLPDGKMAMVIPAMNMAMALDPSSVLGGGGGRGRGAAPQTSVTDVSISVDDLGAGEAIAGHPTHKYRMHRKYTLNGAPHNETSDIWAATDISAAGAFSKLGSFFAGSGGQQVSESVISKMPKGMLMKVVSTFEQTTSTIEVTDVKKTSFSDSDFELPPGVQVMDMSNLMGGRRGGGK